MYPLLKIIDINKALCNVLEENVYNMFLDGYCLEYFEILKHFYPQAKLVVEKNKDHCAALIDNEVYDVSGIRQKDLFYEANYYDEGYVYSFYKRFSLSEKQIVYDALNIDAITEKNNAKIINKKD